MNLLENIFNDIKQEYDFSDSSIKSVKDKIIKRLDGTGTTLSFFGSGGFRTLSTVQSNEKLSYELETFLYYIIL